MQKIAKEERTSLTYPATAIATTAAPIRTALTIVTALGTNSLVNLKYKGTCKTTSIKNIIPKTTGSITSLWIARVT